MNNSFTLDVFKWVAVVFAVIALIAKYIIPVIVNTGAAYMFGG